jgi:hypothetical protein
MLKLLELLRTIYLDKLIFKSKEYKEGFLKAIQIVEFHGFKSEAIHETKTLRERIEQATIELEFLKSQLQLEREKIISLKHRLDQQRAVINTLTDTDTKRSVKRLRYIANILLSATKDSHEKVGECIAYIKSIKENKN